MIISILKPFLCPGCRNLVYFRLPGFSKSTYLESTCNGNLSGTRFCPETVIFSHFSSFSYISIKNSQKLRFLWDISFPRCRNPDFVSKFQFFKKCIFGMCMLWGIYGSKIFPVQILSGIRFCPETVIFSSFSKFIIPILYFFFDCNGFLQPVQACFI